eukprot:152147-Rhodomonas_salina.4
MILRRYPGGRKAQRQYRRGETATHGRARDLPGQLQERAWPYVSYFEILRTFVDQIHCSLQDFFCARFFSKGAVAVPDDGGPG